MNKTDPFGESHAPSGMMPENGVDEESLPMEEPIQVEHVGALLCATRMRMGGDLQEIAKALRIRYGYLVAIEDGRHEDLPGATYSVGFVRAYADYLGLNGEEVVRRLREENSGTPRTPRYEFPSPSGESGLPNGGLLAIAVSLGMIVYGAWYSMSSAERTPIDLIQEVPSRLAVLLDDEAASEVASEDFARAPETIEAQEILAQPAEAEPQSELEAFSDTTGAEQSVADNDHADTEQAIVAATLDVDQTASAVEDDRNGVVETTVEQQIAMDLPSEAAIDEDDNFQVSDENAALENESVEPAVGMLDAGSEVMEVDSGGQPVPEIPEQNLSVEDADIAATAVQNMAEAAGPDLNTASESPEAENVTEASSISQAGTPEDYVQGTSVAEVSESIEADQRDSEQRSVILPETAGENTDTEVASSAEVEQVSGEALSIELRAKSDSWIQVRDGDDLLLTRLLRQGEVYTVPERSGLTLMTGNAGGLEVFVDGELMPPLGDVGVVRRGVPLSADSLRSGIEPG